MRMRYVLLIVLLMVVVADGCVLFRRAEKKTEELEASSSINRALNVVEQKDWTRYANEVLVHQDSSKSSFDVMIWPKGSFTFSAGGGFTGEAEKVLLSGSAAGFGSSSSALEVNEQDQGKVAAKLNVEEQVSASSHTVNDTGTAWWRWIIAAVVVSAIAGFWLYIK